MAHNNNMTSWHSENELKTFLKHMSSTPCAWLGFILCLLNNFYIYFWEIYKDIFFRGIHQLRSHVNWTCARFFYSLSFWNELMTICDHAFMIIICIFLEWMWIVWIKDMFEKWMFFCWIWRVNGMIFVR